MHYTASNLDIGRDAEGRFAPFVFGSSKGACTVSVQGSITHYCSPKETLSKLSDYNSVELCIMFTGDTKITMDDLSAYMPAHLHARFRDQGDGDFLAGWVLVAQVEAVLNAVSAAYLKQNPLLATQPGKTAPHA